MAELGAMLEQLQHRRSHLRAELRQLDQAIGALKKVVGRGPRSKYDSGSRERRISAAGLRRIRAAQKARWAKFRSKNRAA